jgi:hypothetical protein
LDWTGRKTVCEVSLLVPTTKRDPTSWLALREREIES